VPAVVPVRAELRRDALVNGALLPVDHRQLGGELCAIGRGARELDTHPAGDQYHGDRSSGTRRSRTAAALTEKPQALGREQRKGHEERAEGEIEPTIGERVAIRCGRHGNVARHQDRYQSEERPGH